MSNDKETPDMPVEEVAVDPQASQAVQDEDSVSTEVGEHEYTLDELKKNWKKPGKSP